MLKGSLAVTLISLVVWPSIGAAQQNAQGQDNQTSPASRPSRGNRASFQQAQLKRLQEQLGSVEEEWTVVEPRLQKVLELQRDSIPRGIALTGGLVGRGRRAASAGPAGANPAEPAQSPVQLATRELQDSLGSKETKSEEIKSRLVALREARSKAAAELSKAQDQLREVLTARQEAALVAAGLLN